MNPAPMPRNDADAAGPNGSQNARRGQILAGTYRLLERIGVGGMAEVYRAEHVRLGRAVAVKLLRGTASYDTVRRFHKEVEAISRLESEHVVAVTDCGETTDGVPYLVMDLLRGEDLRRLLKRDAPLPIPRAVNLVLDACRGVAAVHAAGLVHRDLKPENLFLTTRSDGQDWCKVLDFGVAKLAASGSTAEGTIVGTVRYMAPEQLRSGSTVDAVADIYALGAILYECLTGKCPHSAATVPELMYEIMNDDALPVTVHRDEVPAGLSAAIARALEKSPHDRFADVQSFARSIEPYAGSFAADDERPSAPTVEIVELALPRAGIMRSVKRAVALSFVCGCALGVVACAAWFAMSRRASAPDHAAPGEARSTPPPARSSPASAREERVAALESAPSGAVQRTVSSQSNLGKPQPGEWARTLPKPPKAPRPSGGLAERDFDDKNPYLR